MKNIIKVIILGFAISVVSCEDFLDRVPLDEISPDAFYKTPQDLEIALNQFYGDFNSWAGVGNGFSGLPDGGTDLVTGESASARLIGNYTTATTANTTNIWNWTQVREINFYLDRVDQAEGNEIDVNHFIGEGYFFRAFFYFELLVRYGDLPIIDRYITNADEDYLYKARDPRNEVVDFMLSDLDTAISLLKSFPDLSSKPRVSKEVAQLFKARIALYEGTWEKYHNGTDFGVDGSDGSAYIQIAANAAKDVIDGGVFSLDSDYGSVFTHEGVSNSNEIMLWRDYDISIASTIGNDLQVGWPNRSSYTRFAIRSYLCTDGQPISVSPLYVGDQDLSTIETDRDPRLAATLMVPGDVLKIETDGEITLFEGPEITTNGGANGGYESQKYRIPNIGNDGSNTFTRNTSKVLFRYAEALLIYAEAKAELGTITQADIDISINELRTRPSVNMPDLMLGGITTDPDWPNYGYTLSDILYEVRRERSVELMAEGFRLDDLMRWRAHELFDGALPRGAYFNDGYVNLFTNESDVILDDDGYISPYASEGVYNFDENRAYLFSIPSDEIILNPNLDQNPGWE